MKKVSEHSSQRLATVLLCIDYRFWPHVLPILKKEYGAFDLIEVAGASKNLASPEKSSDRDYIIENIKTSLDLHHTKTIILTNHIDCGAYGGSKKFESRDQEVLFHAEELKKAKKIIKKHFPRHRVIALFISRDDKDNISLLPINKL